MQNEALHRMRTGVTNPGIGKIGIAQQKFCVIYILLPGPISTPIPSCRQ
jgi:hypothetical protein